ncbi:isoleucine N-monooxygenase 1 [Lactuca sativa]|nr:isoleucine N-monooxygenase 1 [Lactuca sativa]
MLLNRPTFRWIHKLMAQYQSPILCIRLGPSTHVIPVSCPNLACEFLRKQDEVFSSRPDILSADLISDGYRTAILSPSGGQWRKMRKMVIQVILSASIHKWLQPKRDEEANHLLRYICNQIEKQDTATKGGLVNIRVVSQHFCGNLMRNMIFGRRFFGDGMEDGGPGVEETEHVASVFTMLKYLYAFCITDYFPWLRGKTDFDGHEKIVRTAIQGVRKYQDPLIDERIQMWNKGVRKVKNDLLDVLINHESPKPTAEEIKAQIIELMIATVDNPSNAIEWAMAEMLNQPTILKRAVEELDHEVGRERLVEERDLHKLNYIKACIKEAFRLHPLDPFNPPHVSMMNTTVAGYFIPKGSHVLLSRPGLGRNPNIWKDAMQFNPDRHLDAEGKQVVLSDNELRLLSFSTGRRGCPAVVLGSTITTMLLARMLQAFTWEAPPNESGIKLVENQDDLSLANPLLVVAIPRLHQSLYPKN